MTVQKDAISLNPNHQKRPKGGPIPDPRLVPGRSGQERFAVDTLYFHGLVESDPSDTHDRPIDHRSSCTEAVQKVKSQSCKLLLDNRHKSHLMSQFKTVALPDPSAR